MCDFFSIQRAANTKWPKEIRYGIEYDAKKNVTIIGERNPKDSSWARARARFHSFGLRAKDICDQTYVKESILRDGSVANIFLLGICRISPPLKSRRACANVRAWYS